MNIVQKQYDEFFEIIINFDLFILFYDIDVKFII